MKQLTFDEIIMRMQQEIEDSAPLEHKKTLVVISQQFGQTTKTRSLQINTLTDDIYYDTAVHLGWEPDDEKVDDPLLYLSNKNVKFIKRVKEE